ncbi:YjhX family toxin [Flexibacterium corallicola]|uniref:YjhX family toxin n=1 Tax=Flexibacterium corallicola TaxID=3037259 RepID=UPI00286F956C|nr:YjhX family toxin [Pseudovibrio sp. M1P-2-3]
MDISKAEQRIMHVLAQGGCIEVRRDENGKIQKLNCVTRDGWHFNALNLKLFRKLKQRKMISSKNSAPYRITKLGLIRVRSQVDNR